MVPTADSTPLSGAGRRLAEALARLDSRQNWERRDRSKGWRVDLRPVADLAARLGSPERGPLTVHVTGTKGKGSVASLAAAALTGAGYRTGLYTSPHVERIHERIRIDGRPIDDAALADAVEAALGAHDDAIREGTAGADASWFDLVTCAAFVAFRAAGVDASVVEVGLGGRLDSTNVVQPEVAVITNVALEHTAILGATHAAIAREKAGILKRGADAVSGVAPDARSADAGSPHAGSPHAGSPDAGIEGVRDAAAVIAARAAELGVPLTVVPPREGESIAERNVRLARAVLERLGARGWRARTGAGAHIGAELLTRERELAARLPGRMELRYVERTPVLLDGAHVTSSLALLLDDAAREPLLTGPAATVVAVHVEKDAARLLAPLRRLDGPVFCTTLPTGVHQPAGEVAARAREAGLDAREAAVPERALAAALEAAGPGGWVLVTGSLYLCGALRASTAAAPLKPDPPTVDAHETH